MKLKNLGLFMMLILLCGNSHAAQKEIDKAEYEKLIDYVNCYYVKAYITQDAKGTFQDDWEKRANKIGKIYDTSPNDVFKKIQEEIKKGGGYATAKSLCDFINDKKKDFAKDNSNEQIIAKLIELPKDSYAQKLNTDKGNLKKDLEGKLGTTSNQESESKSDVLPKNTPPESQNVSKGKTGGTEAEKGMGKKDKNSESNSLKPATEQDKAGNGLLYFLFVLLGGGLAYIFISSKRQITALGRDVKYLKEKMKDYKSTLPAVSSVSTDSSPTNQLNERDYDRIIDSVIAQINLKALKADLKHELSQTLQASTSPKPPVTGTVVNNDDTTTLYADSISNDFFNRVSTQSNEDTVFELNLKNANVATFTVYHQVYSRVIKRPEFLEGCDKQILPNAQTVHIESLGEVQKQPDGRWKITKKAKIILN
jgi:hypothetical protein